MLSLDLSPVFFLHCFPTVPARHFCLLGVVFLPPRRLAGVAQLVSREVPTLLAPAGRHGTFVDLLQTISSIVFSGGRDTIVLFGTGYTIAELVLPSFFGNQFDILGRVGPYMGERLLLPLGLSDSGLSSPVEAHEQA